MRVLKWMGYGLLTVLLLLAALTAALWLGQDKITGLVLAALNRQLLTPVQVERVELAWWQDFPRLSVTLHRVRLGSSLPADTAALAQVRELHCAFDASDLLSGRYHIRALALHDGTVRVRHDARGRANYQVFRPDTTTAEPATFALEQVRLHNVAVSFADSVLRQHYALQATDVAAALSVTPDTVALRVRGPVRVETVRLGTDHYLRQRDLTLATNLSLARGQHQLRIGPSEVRVGAATYALQGAVAWQGPTQLNLRVDGKNTDVQSLLALLPPRLSQPLAAYRSRGEVYFGGTVQGEMSARRSPRVAVEFGCRDASFFHPETKQTLEHVNLKGSFSNGARATARQAVLELRDVRGSLRGRPFSGSLRYANFQDPSVQLKLKADLDVADALHFYPVGAVRQASGRARLDVRLAGNLRTFRQNPARAAAQAAGELQLRGVSLHLRDLKPTFSNLSGSFILRRNDVAVSDFRGSIGKSDFQLNGMFRNALGWLLLPNQALHVEADVNSRLLDLDQLLSASAGTEKPATSQAATGEGYALKLPGNLTLDLNAKVQQLRFRRLRGRDARGTVLLRGQVLSTPGVALKAAGGSFSVRGSLDAHAPNLVKAHTVASCQQVPLDSLFYVFEDFGQQFITARHLRGLLTATADADVFFTPQLEPLTDRLEAEVHATVRRGELNDFAPLQKLSMVASREQLRHLRFDELTNTVYIQSRTVYVPDMEIRSNVRAASHLLVSGTHTFDQKMDYHLAVPILPGLRRPTLAGPDGSLTTGNGPALLLHVWGDENNFRVGYDTQRALARRGDKPAPTAPAGGVVAQADPAPAAAPTESAPAPVVRLKELLKPKAPAKPAEKKPATPEPGEYFEF